MMFGRVAGRIASALARRSAGRDGSLTQPRCDIPVFVRIGEASLRCPASLGFHDARAPVPATRVGDPEGIRASSPAGATGTSEPVGADLPEARDGEGQLSKDALRSPAPGAACEVN
jgi:hypothetical protein